MRSFHFPGRSPVYARRAMCATSHPLGEPDRDRDPQGRRQCRRCGDRHRRRAGRGGVPHDRHRRRLLCHTGAARREADRPQRRRPRAEGRHCRLVRQEGHCAHRDDERACGDRARRDRRLVPAARGSRHDAAGKTAGARHRSRRTRVRGCPARCRRLGERHAQIHERRRQAQPAEGRSRAPGGRGDALSGAGGDPRADREGWPRRLLRGRGGPGHGGRARGARRPAHARRLRGAGGQRQLRRSGLGRLPGRRSRRAAAQQPGHRRPDHAEDARPPRQGQRRAGFGRALSRADGGGAARLRHARCLRRRPGHGRRAGRPHAR